METHSKQTWMEHLFAVSKLESSEGSPDTEQKQTLALEIGEWIDKKTNLHREELCLVRIITAFITKHPKTLGLREKKMYSLIVLRSKFSHQGIWGQGHASPEGLREAYFPSSSGFGRLPAFLGLQLHHSISSTVVTWASLP